MSKVLIVDDNAQNLYLARYLLEKNGHDIDEAVNGALAVQAAEENSYDLILMDIQMPVLDGLEATRKIKSKNKLPIIVALTAKAMAGDAEMIMAAGCDGYIVKPIESHHFARQVESYLDDK